MQIIRFADLTETPWKNGGGITREIAAARQGEAVLWRLSMADVATEGAFSNFAGLMRVLTVIEGAGMALETPQGQLRADLFAPLRFDGALAVHATLTAGPIRDLNLIFDPGQCEGHVQFVRGPKPFRNRVEAPGTAFRVGQKGAAAAQRLAVLPKRQEVVPLAAGPRLICALFCTQGAIALPGGATLHPFDTALLDADCTAVHLPEHAAGLVVKVLPVP